MREVTYPHITMTLGAHDRAGLNRSDQEWLDTTWADPATRVLVLAKGRLRPSNGRPDWLPTSEAPAGLRVLLGERDGVWHFAVLLDEVPEPSEFWVGLRAVVQSLADESPGEAPLIFHAFGVAEWHRVTKFCPRDGAPLEVRVGRPRTGVCVVWPVPVPTDRPRRDHDRGLG